MAQTEKTVGRGFSPNGFFCQSKGTLGSRFRTRIPRRNERNRLAAIFKLEVRRHPYQIAQVLRCIDRDTGKIIRDWKLFDVEVVCQRLNSLLGFTLFNEYSSDPNRRMRELLDQSEDLREIEDEWERFWFLDQPSHMTPYRTHGGMGP